MKSEKRNPIGYRTTTRMEEERNGAEESQMPHSAKEQAAQDHFETGSWQNDAEQTIKTKSA